MSDIYDFYYKTLGMRRCLKMKKNYNFNSMLKICYMNILRKQTYVAIQFSVKIIQAKEILALINWSKKFSFTMFY